MRISRRGQVFATICLFAYLVNFSRVAFAPLVRPFQEIFHVGAGTAGFVATTVWIGSAASRLPTGFLLTRVDRQRAIVGMGLFMAAAASATAVAPTITLVTVGAFLIGTASGVFYIAANPLVSELYPSRVGWAVGIRAMSAQIAAVSAPFVVGLALVHAEWETVFFGIAGTAVVATALLSFAAGRTEMPEAGAEDKDLIGAVRRQWRLILTGIAILGVTGFVWQGTFNFYDTYLTSVKQFSDSTSRGLLMLLFAAGVPAMFFSGRLADRFRTVPLMFSILGLFTVLLASLTFLHGVWAVAALSVVLGLVIHSLFPVIDTYMLASLPDDNRASAYAVYSATMMLMQAPGSVVFGLLVEHGIAFDTVFRGSALSVAFVLAVLVVLFRDGRLPAGA
ncbi:MAG: MFS transporter [Halobacteriaceae archaeon]